VTFPARELLQEPPNPLRHSEICSTGWLIAFSTGQWADAVKERINPHALDHLTHLWQYFRNSKERRQATNTIHEVTGQHSQSLEEFFREDVKSFGVAAQ
jgi:hypothetical protein